MSRLLPLLLLCFLFAVLGATPGAWAQGSPPVTQWDRTLGGSERDLARVVLPTRDGGYLLGGYSNSPAGALKTQPRRGADDYWVIKFDAQGVRQWDRTLGGTSTSLSYLSDAQQTADGGFLLGGVSNSGPGGDRTAASRGNFDYWIVKLDAQGGTQWDRAYGGSGPDYFTSLRQTTDGGYVLGGYSGSAVGGDKSQPSRGVYDYWVLKVDAQGAKQWDRTFGGVPTGFSGASQLQRVLQTADGGYILGGIIEGTTGGDQTQASRGGADYWLVKLNAQGTKQWDRTFGGPDTDVLVALCPTPDGGFALAGTSSSGVGGEKSEPCRGQGDYWLVKTDAQGQRQWDRTFGGADHENLRDVCLGADGGYLLAGTSPSPVSGDKTQPALGDGDVWLVKADDRGATQWDRTLGGAGQDDGRAVHAAPDGGYILGAGSESGASADKSEPSLGQVDVWLVKLAPPQVRITGPGVVCAGNPTQLVAVATGAVLAYRWNTGATTAALPVTQPGSYTVTATFVGGYTSSATQIVTPFSAVATIGGDTVLCPGRGVVLTAGAAGATGLLWSTGATTPALAVNQPGTYALVATYPGGCTSRAQVRVRASAPLPPFSLGRDTTLCDGTTLQLAAPAGAAAYRWSTGATTPTLLVGQAGTYTVQLTTACDTRSASRVVNYRPCAVIPNVITPNGDRLNDRFVVQGLAGDWTLQLYNRWGQRVYATGAYRNEWGPEAAPGVYYYVLTQAGRATVYKGWVEVIR